MRPPGALAQQEDRDERGVAAEHVVGRRHQRPYAVARVLRVGRRGLDRDPAPRRRARRAGRSCRRRGCRACSARPPAPGRATASTGRRAPPSASSRPAATRTASRVSPARCPGVRLATSPTVRCPVILDSVQFKEAAMTVPTPDVSGTEAGVPFVAYAPQPPRGSKAPVVIAWHLLDAPQHRACDGRCPSPGRPRLLADLSGAANDGRLVRCPAAIEEVMRLGYEDAVRNLHSPIAEQAAAEFPARRSPSCASGSLWIPTRVALLGGSAGAAVAQLVLLERTRESGITPRALVLISPVIRLRALVDALAVQFGFRYPWDDGSLDLARRLDFVDRADEFVGAGGVPDPDHRRSRGRRGRCPHPVRAIERRTDRAATPTRSDVDRVVVPGMAHALADDPSDDPAPQITCSSRGRPAGIRVAAPPPS